MQEQQQEVQQHAHTRARSLANLLTTIRSVAHLYPSRNARRFWLERILTDTRFDEIVRTYTSDLEVLPCIRSAIVAFCLGHSGAYTFGDILRNAYRTDSPVAINCTDVDGTVERSGGDRNEETEQGPTAIKRLRLYDSSSSDSDRSPRLVDSTSTDPSNSSDPHSLVPTDDFNSDAASTFDTSRVDSFWLALYERFKTLTVTEGTTNDGYDARIEFARQFVMDSKNVIRDVGRRNAQMRDTGANLLVTDVECIAKLTALSHLNKSMVKDRATIDSSPPDGPIYTDTKYPVYVFGSNCIWMRSDAMYTLPIDGFVPPIFENETEIKTFTEHLMSYTYGRFVPDQDACRIVARETNSAAFTSLSIDGISLQFSFAMPDSRLYTANMFYLDAGDTCSTDVKYKRQYLSNACQCENRLVQLRFVVSMAAFDGETIELAEGGEMYDLIIGVIRAFYCTKYQQGAHMYINHFTGLALVNYMNDSVALGGMKKDVNIADDNSTAESCYLHRWLRGHMTTMYWSSVRSPQCMATLLLRIPQMLIVYRPLISETTSAVNGPNIFVNYKSFDDVLLKYVLLSLDTLRNGYGHKRKGVAYKNEDSYWIFSDERKPIHDDRSEGAPSTSAQSENADPEWVRAADRLGAGPSTDDDIISREVENGGARRTAVTVQDLFLNPRRDVEFLFRRVFSAPSRLYVYSDVLAKLGFNVTAVSTAVPTRTFTHTDRDTRSVCTVICSSPVVVMDETSNRPLQTENDVQTLRVLKDSQEFDSALEKNRDAWDVEAADAYEERTVSLNDFWPGVRVVKISFKDPVLKNVHFVFFAAADGCDSIRRLTANGLTRLERFNMHSSTHIIPPPVLYTLQQMFVHITNGLSPTSSTSSPGIENGW